MASTDNKNVDEKRKVDEETKNENVPTAEFDRLGIEMREEENKHRIRSKLEKVGNRALEKIEKLEQLRKDDTIINEVDEDYEREEEERKKALVRQRMEQMGTGIGRTKFQAKMVAMKKRCRKQLNRQFYKELNADEEEKKKMLEKAEKKRERYLRKVEARKTCVCGIRSYCPSKH